MKKFNLLLGILIGAGSVSAQETTVSLSLEPGYSKNVYFDFETGQSESFDVASWDIAFMRTSAFLFAERINDGLGIEVYEASDNPDDYATINPANIDNWIQLYNSDTLWEGGAFDYGSASYGWGEYNSVTHHVTGTIVYVLKYADGNFKKFMIDDFYNGYTFKYANWNTTNSTWENPQTVVLPNSENQGKLFNFYSLTQNQSVVASPDLENWDLVFQTYTTDLEIMYPVIGALQNPNVTVAKSTNTNVNSIDESEYKEEINTVGYDWKQFDGSGYIVDSDTYYFLKYNNGKVFRFHFISFDGSSTGNFELAYEDVTGQMSVLNFDEKNSLSIYPNPVKGKILNLLYESNEIQPAKVEIYDMTGKLVAQEQLQSNGYFNHKINLNHLSKGIYILKFNSGKYSDTKKIVIE
ncbi:MAG: T9SS type A sorting domain-containing protein [Weeksellaceae bacterium]|nr:T9SS type A sorting domain-containing protein [Weeksellaceae bacterium]